jgi:hypothetical protein
MKHLTMTGVHAGRKFCGKPREEDDDCLHAFVGGGVEFIDNNRDQICPECLAEYDAVMKVYTGDKK